MGIVFSCRYCGKEHSIAITYEGSMVGVFEFLENKEKTISENCECRGGMECGETKE